MANGASWLAVEYGVVVWRQVTGTARLVRAHGAIGPALEQATALAHAHPVDIVTVARQEVLRFGWGTGLTDGEFGLPCEG